ncbi:MAG: CBS domain-containing protein [Sideroxydans sp.]|nr:CBS domain-containing protein [Sideroxydans sp.]
MISRYNALTSVPLKVGTTCMRPMQSLPERVKLSSPAIDVMTDLSKISVVSVRAKTSMDKANAKMIKYGVRMLLVLDDNEQMAGLVTASDVMGEKPMRYLQHMGGTHADIMVRDIMTPQRELVVMTVDDVHKAKVGDIVVTLKQAHRQHALVACESADGRQTVCGLFSVTQIARQLGAEVHNFELAQTFAEIEAVIAQG